ncbi:MAG: bacteriocin maturation radical enzyme, partial [Acidobacteria bacterium]|nr:bacteriocin maturation radical enzyme [Acidobacteriota bacterium]
NLRCSYCYQNGKQRRAMGWPVLQAALDVLLALPAPALNVSFYGGEPTLEFGSLRRAVEYLTGLRGVHRVTFHVTTNGVLVQREQLAFLARHDFLVDVSMDGAASAQDLRQAETFRQLDALLGRWRSEHPAHFDRRCRVAVTLTRAGIPHLADSFEYLLAKHVPCVALQAVMAGREWSGDDLEQLDSQLARIGARSLDHYRQTGNVPLAAFGGGPDGQARDCAATGDCVASRGELLAVDVDGTAYACALAARSYQRFENGDVDRALQRLALGNVRDHGFAARLEALPAITLESGVFVPRPLQHAGGRACAACPDRGDCFVCPIVRARQAPPGDRNAVPVHLCAFNRLLAKHRRRFRERSGAGDTDRLLSWLFSEGRPSS